MSAGFELRGPTPYRCYIEKRYTVMAQSEAEAELKAMKLLLQDLSGDLEQFTIVSEADESLKKEGTRNVRKKIT